tara:strand:- start:397 stop:651 length:255 start_codon:yes stop_codon:yes gene_type:complete
MQKKKIKLTKQETRDIALDLVEQILEDPKVALEMRKKHTAVRRLEFDHDCLNREYKVLLAEYEELRRKHKLLLITHLDLDNDSK